MKPLLEKTNLGKAKENLKELTDILAITKTWVIKYRNTGHSTLPIQTPIRPYHHKRPSRIAFSNRTRPSVIMSQPPSDFHPSEDDDISWNEEDDFPVRIEAKPLTENENKGTLTDQSTTDDKSSTDTHGTEHLDTDTKDVHQMEPQTNRIEGSHKDVKTTDDTKSPRSEDNEVYETEPLIKYSDGLNDEKIMENENDDPKNIINTRPPSEHAAESVESHVETGDEENDETSSEIYHTTPFTPEFLDMAEPAELDNYKTFETSQEIKPLQVDVDAPAEAFVKRTFPKNDMEKPLDEQEETTDSSMSEPGNKDNMKDCNTFMGEPLDKKNKENAASSMTNSMNMNDNAVKSSSLDEDKDHGSKTKEKMDKSLDASMTKLEKQDIEEPTKTAGSEKPLKEDSKESVGSPMEEMLNKVSEESVSSPVEKPQNKDSDESTSSLVKKPQNKDSGETVGSPVEKPLNKDSKESVDSPVEKPQNKDFEESMSSLVKKPQNKDLEESVGSPIKISEESVGSQIRNKTKDHPQSVSRFFSFFRRRRYRSVYRRYRSVYRRYRSVYRRRRFSSLARRRRLSSARYGRRRRSQLSRRRRASPSVARINPRQPDETENIKKFLSKFYCSFRRPYIHNMMLRESCMDKIQKRIRKYNRVAFAHFAKKHGHARIFGWGELMRKLPNDEDVLVKTEL